MIHHYEPTGHQSQQIQLSFLRSRWCKRIGLSFDQKCKTKCPQSVVWPRLDLDIIQGDSLGLSETNCSVRFLGTKEQSLFCIQYIYVESVQHHQQENIHPGSTQIWYPGSFYPQNTVDTALQIWLCWEFISSAETDERPWAATYLSAIPTSQFTVGNDGHATKLWRGNLLGFELRRSAYPISVDKLADTGGVLEYARQLQVYQGCVWPVARFSADWSRSCWSVRATVKCIERIKILTMIKTDQYKQYIRRLTISFLRR